MIHVLLFLSNAGPGSQSKFNYGTTSSSYATLFFFFLLTILA